MGSDLSEAERVLDFGCGCGRTLRWLTKRYPAATFFGADIDADAIAWCSQNFPESKFVQNAPAPPLPFPNGYLDVVFCFSVFTHLDEPLQNLWLVELQRVLRPGGILVLTVHGEKAAQTLGAEECEQLRQIGFFHQRSRKLRGIVPEWYNTSWHTEPYIIGRLQTLFTDVRYTVVPDGTQDLVAARVPTKK